MSIFLWFCLLALQSAAFTWVSRARNSGSIAYHATASIFSNGTWFASQFILIGMVAEGGKGAGEFLFIGSVYVAGTVCGSVIMHWLSMRFLEKGSRKVGAGRA